MKLPGIHTTEPTFGLPATWVDAALKEEAAIKGYTVVDAATVLSTHLTELIKANVAELLSYAEVQQAASRTCRRSRATWSRTSCRRRSRSPASSACCRSCSPSASRSATSPTILEGIADGGLVHAQSGDAGRARARAALAPDLRAVHDAGRLSAADRAVGASGSRHSPNRSSARATTARLAMQPSRLTEFITLVRERFEEAARAGRGAGAGDLGRHPAVRARHRRALPRADAGAVAGGNSSARAAEDGGEHLGE